MKTQRIAFFLLLFFLFSISVFGQIPKGGDSYILKRISDCDFNINRTAKVWDFSGSEPTDEVINVTYKEVCDSNSCFLKLLPNSISHYVIRGDSLLNTGYENRKFSMTYCQPIEEYICSLNAGDSLSGYVIGKGRYCEEFPCRLYGRYKLVCDGYGTLVLPEGDTLTNIRYIRQELLSSYEDVFDFAQLDTTYIPLSYVPSNLASSDKQYKETRHKWYMGTYPYPVLEACYNEMYENGKLAGSDSQIYYNTDILSCPMDERNMIRRNTGRKFVNEQRKNNAALENVSYKVDSDSNGTLKLKFDIKQDDAQVSFGIYTIDGIVLYESEKPYYTKGIYSEKVELPYYKHKTLVFRLQSGNKEITETIFVK